MTLFAHHPARGASLGLALAAILGAMPLEATVLEKIDFETLCRASDRIVLARCTSEAAAWDEPAQLIETTYTFAVSETVKGEVAEIVRVASPGGVVGDKGMNISGAPRFVPGEQYVLFLERSPDGKWRCKGWTQGRYEIVTDPETGEKTVQGDTSGVTLASPGPGKAEHGGPGRRVRLGEFLDSIRDRAGTSGGDR